MISEAKLSITLDFLAGTDIADACVDAVNESARLECTVYFMFNRVLVVARRDDDPAELRGEWEKAMNGRRKVAFCGTL
jgi:hypothetical protein